MQPSVLSPASANATRGSVAICPMVFPLNPPDVFQTDSLPFPTWGVSDPLRAKARSRGGTVTASTGVKMELTTWSCRDRKAPLSATNNIVSTLPPVPGEHPRQACRVARGAARDLYPTEM